MESHLPKRGKLPHEAPGWVGSGSWFFVTVCCEARGRNQLCRAGVGDEVLEAVQFNHARGVWFCRVCLLMPDHLHAVLAFAPSVAMEKAMADWKHFVAVKCGVVWQRDFFDHRLRNEGELAEKEDYIGMNPVRRGLCERTEDWIWVWRASQRRM